MTRSAILLSIIFCCLAAAADDRGEKLPDEISLRNMQVKTANLWAGFERKIFVPMLEYYYNREFVTDENKQVIYESTLSVENALKNLHSEQLTLKSRIEEYDGTDWDLRYGKNGLWRSFDSLTSQTVYLIAKCLYYRALSQSGEERGKTVSAVLERTAAIRDGVSELHRDMLEAQVYMLDRKSNEKAYDAIFSRLDAVEKKMTADTELYYDMWICRLNLMEPFSVTQLNRIIDNFKSSQMADFPSIAMRLAFLQLQVRQSDMLKICLDKWPHLAAATSKLIYQNVQKKFYEGNATQYVTGLTLFEKELAALASIHKSEPDIEKVITSFGEGDKYPSRVLHYSAAVSNAGSNPEIAVDCAVNALMQPAAEAEIFADVNDLAILTVGVKAGYSLLGGSYQTQVLDLFDRYLVLAGTDADPKLVFGYAAATKKVRPEESRKLLNDIYKGKGAYSDKALFELLIDNFNDDKDISAEIVPLYKRVDTSDVLFYSDVTDLYCRYLANIAEVAKSLQILEKAYQDKLKMHSGCGVYVLRKYLENAEHIIDKVGNDISNIAVNIAGQIINDESNTPEVRLLYIETTALAGWKSDRIGKMPEFSDAYDAFEFSMAKARYEMSAGNFYEAAFIWSRISRSILELKPVPLSKWQRAKYYQIYCSLESGKVPQDEILHSIQVLEADRNWIEGYWAQRLINITPAAAAPQAATL